MWLQKYKVRCSKTANNNSHVSRVCMRSKELIFQWSDAENYLKLKSLFWRYSVNTKNEKNRLNILVDPWPVTARNTDERKFITFLIKGSICRHLLTQRVWISFENPLNGLISFQIVTLRDKMVWQEGWWLRNAVKRGKLVVFLIWLMVTFFEVTVKYYYFFPYKII